MLIKDLTTAGKTVVYCLCIESQNVLKNNHTSISLFNELTVNMIVSSEQKKKKSKIESYNFKL